MKTKMSEKQDSGDEVQVISRKFRSATSIESVHNAGTEQQSKSVKSVSPTCCQESKICCTPDENMPTRNLPELNLPEKILFVIDTTRELNFTPFKFGNGTTHNPLSMIKRAVETFVWAKSTMQRLHEYALMIIDSKKVRWICDFTSNAKTIVNHLDTVGEDLLKEEQRTFDLDPLFKEVLNRAPLPKNDLPAFATRVILIYSRSNCVPKFETGTKCLEILMENPYFFLDVLFVHEPVGPDNICEQVYKEITALDTTSFSYILEVGRNAAKLHDNMAMLLAHPLQRPLQRDACYTSCIPTTPHVPSRPQEVVLSYDEAWLTVHEEWQERCTVGYSRGRKKFKNRYLLNPFALWLCM